MQQQKPIIVQIFTASSCSQCHLALEITYDVLYEHEKYVTIEEISLATKEGQQLAKNNNIKTTPTILINREKMFTSVPTRKRFESRILELIESRSHDSR